MRMDPHARRRVETVSVEPAMSQSMTNADLLEAWLRTYPGSKQTVGQYRNYVLGVLDYFRNRHVRTWTKPEVWAYIHYAEGNFCANFQQLAFMVPVRAQCKAGQWEGHKDANEAAVNVCRTCPLFKRTTTATRKRMDALDGWFTYLTAVGVVPFNFVHDVKREWKKTRPKHLRRTHEKKRNPTVEEMVQLVNGTSHPARRAFFACSAKWALRPNEMLNLDRYASLGLPMPAGVRTPHGFAEGFQAHPHVLPFDQGGQLVYLPEKYDVAGSPLADKRTGNRWVVVDAELRPILEQYLAWWERTVKRDPATGRPVTTKLWLQASGYPEENEDEGNAPGDLSERWFYPECERLGLMKPGDRKDPRRKWTAHCQRHFSEQVHRMAKVPATGATTSEATASRTAGRTTSSPGPSRC